MNQVWIVEMFNECTRKWEPTIGCSLTKENAKPERLNWTRNNPSDQFRIQKYIAAAKEKP